MNKKINAKIFIFCVIIFFGLFFLFNKQTLAACSWRGELTITFPEIGTSQTTGGCTSSEAPPNNNLGEKCSDSKPTNSSSAGVTRYVCCCEKEATATTESKPPKFVIPDMQIAIPGMATLSEPTCLANDDGTYQCEIPWLGEYIKGIYNYAFAIAGILAALILMAGGLIWLISGGDASRITQAKELIIGSVTGTIILATSYLILIQVNSDLVNLQSISINNIKKIILTDADVSILGGENPYATGCTASKNGDLSVCRAFGNSEPENLISIGRGKANTEVVKKYLAAMECVKQKNNKYLFTINEGWRSALTQIDYKNKGLAAADPCCSNHGSGKALDLRRLTGEKMSWNFNETSGLKECMNSQGLYANLNTGEFNEPWHWSLTGK